MARARRAAPARRPAPSRAPPSRPASTKAATPQQQQQAYPPAPQQQSSGGGMLAGIGSTIAQGMAFGTGSAIAHRTVGAVAESFSGSGNSQPAAAASPMDDSLMTQQQSVNGGGACLAERQIYYDCLRDNRDDGQVCQFLLEQLKACNQNQMYS